MGAIKIRGDILPRLRSNLVDDVLTQIIQRINNYDFVSGDVVSEVALSKELDISRTPIREAIAKLIDIGVLKRENTKVIVTPLSLSDIKEILDARAAIEIMSVRICISQGLFIPQKMDELLELHEKYELSILRNELEKSFEYDKLFHDCLIKTSNNSRLMQFTERLNVQAQRFKRVTIVTPTRYTMTYSEHATIVNAIKNKSIAQASEAILLHIENSKKNYEEILTNDMWLKMFKTLK